MSERISLAIILAVIIIFAVYKGIYWKGVKVEKNQNLIDAIGGKFHEIKGSPIFKKVRVRRMRENAVIDIKDVQNRSIMLVGRIFEDLPDKLVISGESFVKFIFDVSPENKLRFVLKQKDTDDLIGEFSDKVIVAPDKNKK